MQSNIAILCIRIYKKYEIPEFSVISINKLLNKGNLFFFSRKSGETVYVIYSMSSLLKLKKKKKMFVIVPKYQIENHSRKF